MEEIELITQTNTGAFCVYIIILVIHFLHSQAQLLCNKNVFFYGSDIHDFTGVQTFHSPTLQTLLK